MAAVSPHERESGIREIFDVESGLMRFGIRNLKESEIPLTIRIRNPSSTDMNSGIQYLESGIPGVESRMQDCPGFHYIGRAVKLCFTLLRYRGLREVLHRIMALMHVYVRRANFTTKSRFEIGHFRVPKTLTFKMRLGAQLFL